MLLSAINIKMRSGHTTLVSLGINGKWFKLKCICKSMFSILDIFDPRFQHDLDHNDGKFDPYTRFF